MSAESKKSMIIGVCSVLLASLFALSASVQLNDPDWYLWIPLYATASIVNFVTGVRSNASINKMAKFALWLGVVLFVKVVMEDVVHGISGFWSLDMRERVVREKVGSGLVISSMILHLETSSNPTQVAKYGGQFWCALHMASAVSSYSKATRLNIDPILIMVEHEALPYRYRCMQRIIVVIGLEDQHSTSQPGVILLIRCYQLFMNL